MQIDIKAKSSTDIPYEVSFFIKDEKFFAKCNCRAGIFGGLCKHKIELLAGDEGRLSDLSEAASLVELTNFVSGMPFIKDNIETINEAMKVIAFQQDMISEVKRKLSFLLKKGIKADEG